MEMFGCNTVQCPYTYLIKLRIGLLTVLNCIVYPLGDSFICRCQPASAHSPCRRAVRTCCQLAEDQNSKHRRAVPGRTKFLPVGLIHVRLLDASVCLLSPTNINIPLRLTNTDFGFTSQLQPALSSLLVLVLCIGFLVESHLLHTFDPVASPQAQCSVPVQTRRRATTLIHRPPL